MGKKGVVRDMSVHQEVVENVIGMAVENGFSVKGLEFSPVKGPEGNIEYLIYFVKDGKSEVDDEINAHEIVNRSHEELK